MTFSTLIPAVQLSVRTAPAAGCQEIVLGIGVAMFVSAFMSFKEKILVQNIEERLASLDVVLASKQAFYLCETTGWPG
jgi:tartrate dehydratase alpha subunit/fumarate hydratase class I-like protein